MSTVQAMGVAAFVVVVLELVAAVAVVVVARKVWREVGPQVRPLLAMFTGPSGPVTPAGVASPSGRPLAGAGETMPRALDEDTAGAPFDDAWGDGR